MHVTTDAARGERDVGIGGQVEVALRARLDQILKGPRRCIALMKLVRLCQCGRPCRIPHGESESAALDIGYSIGHDWR